MTDGELITAIMTVILIQVGFTYLPMSQQLFGLVPLTIMDWLFLTGISALVYLWWKLRRQSGDGNTDKTEPFDISIGPLRFILNRYLHILERLVLAVDKKTGIYREIIKTALP